MDGFGTIQIGISKKKLDYRFIISLDFTKNNHKLLIRISILLGGTIIILRNKNKILWILNEKYKVLNLIDIFTKYPPLTSRLICQLTFIKSCLEHNSTFFKSNLKYQNQLIIIKSYSFKQKDNLFINYYFFNWLTIYIESSISKEKPFFLNIKYDIYLIKLIKDLFKIENKIYSYSRDFYVKYKERRINLHNFIYSYTI